MRPFVAVGCDIPLLGPMTGRSRPHLSLREGLEQTPFPLALHCVGSVLAVKGSLRRFAPWTAPGRSERRAVHEGKGGVRRREGAEVRVASPLARMIKDIIIHASPPIAAGTIDRFPPPDHRGNMWRHE